MYTIEDILAKCKDLDFTIEEIETINNAYKYMVKGFNGKIENYSLVEHYTNVAGIVTDLNADAISIVSALLHGFILDEEIKDVSDRFGNEVVDIILNLAKISRLKLNDYSDSSANYLRKILVGLTEDVRVMLIKLADRLDVMRHAYCLDKEELKQKVNSTMEVYVPIVHRLGINSIKSELENLCLKYSKPDVYEQIEEKLNGTSEELQGSLEEMKQSISDILTEHGINFEIKARVKSIYSIYNKLTTGRKWSDIYDILAMRLIVPTKEDCYLAIGLIHAKYRPIPKRFKDYISNPKENMYQSLHTSIFGIDGNIFEVQVRTPEMDEIAEKGIASHWSYKEHSKSIKNLMEQKLEIFRNTIQMNSDESDEMFAKSMEEELLSTLIYVYTPKGDVMELPEGATPIDFAYRIHSGVGDKTVGAIVNGQIVPLDYELQDGDIIKINTLNSAKPNKDWLSFVKTTQAKNKIKAYFSKKDREMYIESGKDLLEKEIKKQKLLVNDVLTDENIEKLIKDLKVRDYDDLLLSIGSIRYTPAYVISLLYEDKKDLRDIMLDKVIRKDDKPHIIKNDIIVAGNDNIKVSIAKCCHPVPGDNIIGYVSKGEGVIVHREDCKNLSGDESRIIEVSWNVSDDKAFISKLIVKTNSMQNKLLDIVTAASMRNVSIAKIAEFQNDNMIDYSLDVKVKNKDQLELFIEELKKLPFIVEVK